MQNIKNSFLLKFIETASEEGVNEAVILKVSKLIYGDERAYILDFYNGIYDVIEEVEKFLDDKISEEIDLNSISSTTQKVRECLKARIYGKGDRKAFYKSLSAFYKTRQGVSFFLKNTWHTVDAIWYLAGDNSHDWNYYSKRAILFSIYTRNLKFYTNSNDNNFVKTLAKIDIALDRVKNFNNLKQKLKPENIPIIRLFIKD